MTDKKEGRVERLTTHFLWLVGGFLILAGCALFIGLSFGLWKLWLTVVELTGWPQLIGAAAPFVVILSLWVCYALGRILFPDI